MKVIALLAWYDEQPEMLAEAVGSLGAVCRHVIAVDGAYALFPGAAERPTSGPEQRLVIEQAAGRAGIGCTVYVPAQAWPGNEVEKRSYMFELGRELAIEYEDWFLIIDADERVASSAPDFHDRLAGLEHDVASYLLCWSRDLHATGLAAGLKEGNRAGSTTVRGLMRALPGLRCQGAHYVYLAERHGTTVCLWGNPGIGAPQLQDADLSAQLQLEHLHAFRARERQLRAAEYYLRRDTSGSEALHNIYVEGAAGEPKLLAKGSF